MVYILAIYPEDEVWMGSGARAEEGEEEKNYDKWSKDGYIMVWGSFYVVTAIYFFIMFFHARSWVERNKHHRFSS